MAQRTYRQWKHERTRASAIEYGLSHSEILRDTPDVWLRREYLEEMVFLAGEGRAELETMPAVSILALHGDSLPAFWAWCSYNRVVLSSGARNAMLRRTPQAV